MGIVHIPVMREEVIEALKVTGSGVYVDGTVGLGGHAEGILERAPQCTVIGLDRDGRALELARERLSAYRRVHLLQERFSQMGSVVRRLGHETVQGIVLDVGVSTLHLKAEGRGFSFLRDEPLDMRMDVRQRLNAEDVVNSYREQELADLIWRFGEERYSRRIAKAIVRSRRRERIRSCKDLAVIVEKAVGRRGKIHPATRTFQALRIEVNGELDELAAGIDAGAEILERGGRFCVLSYHSLEDRIVKNAFRKLAREGLFRIITKKPLLPAREERSMNPSSRSAKLRVGEKI
ncbi:MAG: 16S rRNA (cytosine(1402)-N(4))-methyltransferase RsmH [Nitrospiraceae bacterium]|nr:MAG: 16S rRNA (cytosine(1402)-N(4))-methyltransferase RsmH [Nitrospiraceae bacterium]